MARVRYAIFMKSLYELNLILGCDKEGITPSVPMVRPNLTTCFRTKNIEDLENTIIHSFSEEGDWILDICCGRRELSLVCALFFAFSSYIQQLS